MDTSKITIKMISDFVTELTLDLTKELKKLSNFRASPNITTKKITDILDFYLFDQFVGNPKIEKDQV